MLFIQNGGQGRLCIPQGVALGCERICCSCQGSAFCLSALQFGLRLRKRLSLGECTRT